MDFKSIVAKHQHLTSATIKVFNDVEFNKELGVLDCCAYFDEVNTITMCIEELQSILEGIELPMSMERIFEISLLHEIGHSLDINLVQSMNLLNTELGEYSKKKIIFESEVRAWRIADTLIDEIDFNYKLLRVFCLDNYAEGHSEWLEECCVDYLG